MRTRDEVIHAFTPVSKLDETQKAKLLRLQVAYQELATEILDLVADCPDRTSSLRKLLESKFTAVQALTHFQTATKPKKEVGSAKEETAKA